ncbi:RNA polymerase sigma factor [Paenibacillus sp. RC67]|uniref:RNA polymerase sigma factor n=1 Tax=Paenibacillus sp. RC67 TaxID=3039392 RepID=UPI0024AD9E8B|nr:RNA polymerase sigma factor [Paenibacillus sp. RC67]
MSAHSTENITETIKQYTKPIFGYALNRTQNREEAEDLAQDIVLQLLKSMTAGAEIRHMNSYIWTVAKYCWIHWLKKRSGTPQSLDTNGFLDDLSCPNPQPLDQLVNGEDYQMLRRELAYLSKMQRQVVVMYYYEGFKQQDIAVALGIPVGTVKWHLHDAKNEIKKGMNRMQPSGQLSFNPIQLTRTGHAGNPGKIGETYDFLKRSLTQNLVYAMYQKPMSVNDLAIELGTPAHFIEDEVNYLAEHGFITETSSRKYRTDFIIWDYTREQLQGSHKLYKECAAELADLHFEALMDIRKNIEATSLYYPDQDYEFLLWTLLPRDIERQGFLCLPVTPDVQSIVPIRKDGGRYIAYAELKKESFDNLGYDPNKYSYNGAMTRNGGGSLSIWQFNTFWSDRPGWKSLTFKDAQLCNAFLNGELPEDEAHAEDYALLLSKQYLLKTDEGYKLNLVWVDCPQTWRDVTSLIPDLSSAYSPAITRLYEQVLKLAMSNQPQHLERQIAYMTRMNTASGRLIPYILNELVDRNKLNPPQPHQRKTITTLMGLIK